MQFQTGPRFIFSQTSFSYTQWLGRRWPRSITFIDLLSAYLKDVRHFVPAVIAVLLFHAGLVLAQRPAGVPDPGPGGCVKYCDGGSSNSGSDHSGGDSNHRSGYVSPRWYTLEKRGRQLLDEGRYADAIAYFRASLEEDPNEWAYRNLGYALAYQGDYHGALEAYEGALAMDPNDPHLLVSYGWILSKLERYNEALDYYRRAASKKKEYQKDVEILERYLAEVKSYDEAIDAYNRKDYAAAAAAYRNVLNLDPTNSDAHYFLARSLWFQGAWAKASDSELVLQEAARAYGLSPNNQDFARFYAQELDLTGGWLAESGNLRAAEARYREALRIDPGDQIGARSGLIANLGLQYNGLRPDDFQGKRELVAKMREIAPERSDVQNLAVNTELASQAVAEFDRMRNSSSEASPGAGPLHEQTVTVNVGGHPEQFVTWLKPSTTYSSVQQQLSASVNSGNLAASVARSDPTSVGEQMAKGRGQLNFDTTGLPAENIIQVYVSGQPPGTDISISGSVAIAEGFRDSQNILPKLAAAQAVNNQALTSLRAQIVAIEKEPQNPQTQVRMVELKDQYSRAEQKQQYLDLAVKERLLELGQRNPR